MKSELEGKNKSLKDYVGDFERLKNELDIKNQELLRKAKLEADIESLQKHYDEKYELIVLVDNDLPTFSTNFWRSKGSLEWLYNYKEALLSVYDIVIEDEYQ